MQIATAQLQFSESGLKFSKRRIRTYTHSTKFRLMIDCIMDRIFLALVVVPYVIMTMQTVPEGFVVGTLIQYACTHVLP
jgi:hypothetical protein